MMILKFNERDFETAFHLSFEVLMGMHTPTKCFFHQAGEVIKESGCLLKYKSDYYVATIETANYLAPWRMIGKFNPYHVDQNKEKRDAMNSLMKKFKEGHYIKCPDFIETLNGCAAVLAGKKWIPFYQPNTTEEFKTIVKEYIMAFTPNYYFDGQ